MPSGFAFTGAGNLGRSFITIWPCFSVCLFLDHRCVFNYGNPGDPSHSILHLVDVLAFSTIVFTAKRPRVIGYPARPSILDTILRDATQYFVLIFSAHFLSTLLLFVAPVGDT